MNASFFAGFLAGSFFVGPLVLLSCRAVMRKRLGRLEVVSADLSRKVSNAEHERERRRRSQAMNLIEQEFARLDRECKPVRD